MGWEVWFTLTVVVLCFSLLATNRAAPDIVMMAGLTLLLVAGVLTPQQALAGLTNEGLVTVAVLYVVVTGLTHTGAVRWLSQLVLGRPRSMRHAQMKMMLPVAGMSAFLNNTPVVAIFIPAIQDWAKRYRLSLSRLMIPLSYAGIAGGTCTLIGTSTNLVVNGLLKTETGYPGLGMFDIAWVGLPVATVIVGYILLFGHRQLPDRVPVIERLEDVREYTVEMLVQTDGPLVEKSIENAGLRQLPGLFLMEIDRNGRVLSAVSPRETLQSNDRLVFVGIVSSVVDLQKIRGLKPATKQVFKLRAPRRDRRLIEAVISNTSPLLGKRVRDTNFRSYYNAVIIALARNGERIPKKIGDIVLRAGDTLLLETHSSFQEQHRNSREFYLVSSVPDSRPIRHDRALFAIGITLAMVVAVASGALSMLKAALLAAGLMMITRCTTGDVARRAVDWPILVVIAASFGIGNALHVTGAAETVAMHIVSLAGGHPWLGLGLVFLATATLTALATNNAAAVLMFPIGLATARSMSVDIMPFAIAIMVGASASFATPVSYQTNLMVYGVGGYRFSDYMRVGLPLTLLVGITTVLVVPHVWPF